MVPAMEVLGQSSETISGSPVNASLWQTALAIVSLRRDRTITKILGDLTDPIWCWCCRKILESFQFSVHIGIRKKWVLTPAKEGLRIDKLASEREGKQTGKAPTTFFHVFLCGLPPEGETQFQSGSTDSDDPDLGRVSTSTNSTKVNPSQVHTTAWVSVNS